MGFIGGLAAVVLTGVVQYFLERQRELKARRAVMRLVWDELIDSRVVLDAMIERSWWSDESSSLQTPILEQNRQLLAANLNGSDWLAVSIIRDRVRTCAALSSESGREGGRTMTEDEKVELRAIRDRILELREELKPHAQLRHRSSRVGLRRLRSSLRRRKE